MLVALRLGLGCHFLYEGLWKIIPIEKFSTQHPAPFTAEPFLTQAKGPLAGYFYAMVPDIDARQRLHVVTSGADQKKSIDSDGITARWNLIRQQFVDYYQPGTSADAAHKELDDKSNKTYETFQRQLKEYLQKNVEDIDAYLGSLKRFENDPERDQTAPYQLERRWSRMMELRTEAANWVKDIEIQELAFENGLYSLLDKEQRERGAVPVDRNPLHWAQREHGAMPVDWNPLHWDQMEQINFAVTFALTAIGACLILGFCNRLAALGGAGFMCFVVMTQPAFPGIYPPDPHVIGHALLVNKDFIEMLALLTVASAPVGRWGGLDYVLYYWIFKPFCCREVKKEQ